MTKGITPLLAYFIIYLAYLNIYNKDDDPITIGKAISFVSPFFLIVSSIYVNLSGHCKGSLLCHAYSVCLVVESAL